MIRPRNLKLILINHKPRCLEIKMHKNPAYFKVKWQLINLILKSRMLRPRKSLCLF